MKTNRWIEVTTAMAMMAAAGLAGAGSLDPPGPPGPTMKTLSQIEPRALIDAVPFTITEPGSYYLTANLTAAGSGVIIEADNVTLDLMGFTLTGSGGGASHGVLINGSTNIPIHNVVVRNGILRNFGNGVRAAYSHNCRFERLIAADNTLAGINLHAYKGNCNGNVIADCSISGNGTYGVSIFATQGQSDGNTVVDCTIVGNGDSGIRLYAWEGQSRGNVIVNCTLRDNTGQGIYLLQNADGNRVENNHISDTTGATSYGIRVGVSSANFILRNTCVGQTNNYSIAGNNTYGPIVTDSGELGTSGAAAHPWANFSR